MRIKSAIFAGLSIRETLEHFAFERAFRDAVGSSKNQQLSIRK